MSTHHQTISPVDGSVCAEFDLASDSEIEATLQRASDAQHQWQRVPVEARTAICRRMVALMVERADPIAIELTVQMGRPVTQTPNEIRRGFQERATYMIDVAAEMLADLPVEAREGFQRFIRRQPLGVILVLAPWNYPYLTSVNAIVPAIMAGNSVILKMALQTPLVAERYAEAFIDAGLPPGVFQVGCLQGQAQSPLGKVRQMDGEMAPESAMVIPQMVVGVAGSATNGQFCF